MFRWCLYFLQTKASVCHKNITRYKNKINLLDSTFQSSDYPNYPELITGKLQLQRRQLELAQFTYDIVI